MSDYPASAPCASDLADAAGWNSYADGPLLAGPLLGEVGPDDAHVWAQARDGGELTLVVYQPDGSARRLTATPRAEDFFCVLFHVDSLASDGSYGYALESAHGSTPRYPLRAGLPAGSRRARIAFGSCYKDYKNSDLPIFAAVSGAQPDLFLMLGDTCYFDENDWVSETAMMRAHLRNRNNDALRPLVASVPVLGVWDDHDYGPNDSDGSFPNKAASLRTFRRMWGQRRYGLDATPGVFSTVRCGPVELFLIDSRYYRRERHQILGAEQLRWLQEALARSSAAVKLVASGSQLLPEVAGLAPFNWECWRRDAHDELEALLSFIEQRGIGGVVFLSGDPHLGFLLHQAGRPLGSGRRGPDFWELTSSPLANRIWPQQVLPADSQSPPLFDRYVLRELTDQNFGLIDVDLDRDGAEVALSLVDAGGAPLLTQPLALASLAGQPATAHRVFAAAGDHAYVWKGDAYVRCDAQSGRFDDSKYPRAICKAWPGVFTDDLAGGLDAALFTGKGRAYFFKGNGYVRYDLEKDRAEAGYPKYIGRHWPGVWVHGLTAAVQWPDGKVYFFSGGECIRYDLEQDRADPGYPRPIDSEFPGVFTGGIDAAVVWPDGKAYFFRGGEYVRYDIAAGRADAPQPFGDDWLGFTPGG